MKKITTIGVPAILLVCGLYLLPIWDAGVNGAVAPASSSGGEGSAQGSVVELVDAVLPQRQASSADNWIEALVQWSEDSAWESVSQGVLTYSAAGTSHQVSLEGTPVHPVGDVVPTSLELEGAHSRALVLEPTSEGSTRLRAWMYPGVLVQGPASIHGEDISVVRFDTSRGSEAHLKHPGRINNADRRPTRSLPAYLPWDGNGQRPYWIRTTHGPWTRVVPSSAAHAAHFFLLEDDCSGSLEIAVVGATRGYALRFLLVEEGQSRPILDYSPLVLDHKELVGLPEVSGTLLFGYGPSTHIRRYPIAPLPATIRCGDTTRVVLDLEAQPSERGTIGGRLSVPGLEILDDVELPQKVSIRVLSESPHLYGVRSFVSSQLYEDMPQEGAGRRFTLGPVPFGEHTLEVLPFGIQANVLVEDSAGANEDILLEGVARSRVRVFAADSTPVEVQSLLAVSHPVEGQRWSLPVREVVPGEWEVISLAGSITLEVGAKDHGYTTKPVHVGAGWNEVTVDVQKSHSRSIRLVQSGSPFRAPVAWWFRIYPIKVGGEGEYENRDVQLTTELAKSGISEVRFLFSGPGQFKLKLPPLDGVQLPEEMTMTVGESSEPFVINVSE